MFENLVIKENKDVKICRSRDYNYNFDKRTGLFMRWGKTQEDNPQYSPFGPEILDLEISVNGCPNKCRFCYKSNTPLPATNMSLETFKKILNKMPKVLTQIAFGITGIQTNPDFIPMMEYCREVGIVPNFTLSGIDLTDEIAEKCAKLVGALAVSAYETDKNVCYNTIKKFTDLGVVQTNMHLMISNENLHFVYEVLNDIKSDNRLSKLNAVVFLGVKPKGRAKNNFTSIEYSKFKELLSYCFDMNISFGFDSCTAPKFEKAIVEMGKTEYLESSESCESFGLFSSYINVEGRFFCCSFTEGEKEWETGLDVLNCEDFLRDIWFHPKLNEWRKKSFDNCYESGCRKCLIFPTINP